MPSLHKYPTPLRLRIHLPDMNMNRCSRDCEENEWEVLPHIPAEDDNCCLGGLGIDPEGLIMVNYFACPSSGRDKYDDRVSFAVRGSPVRCLEDDASRFRNCSDSAFPSQSEEEQGVPGTLDAVAKAEDFDHVGCQVTIRPTLSYTLPTLDPSLFDGGTEGVLRRLWREEEQPAEESECELQILEKLAEESDADDGLQNPPCCCVMECKCKPWWKRPLGILGSQARQIWSFGMAAALMGCLILGRRWYRHKHHNRNHALRFQIYAHDKRINQLMCQAARLNEAFSAARGASVVRAQISFGGYHDGLQILTS